jgi:hypothetical protein
MTTEPTTARDLLRHTLATLAYRGGKTLRGAAADFAQFRAGENTRTPLEILAHLGDLMEWALSIAQGNEKWKKADDSRTWDQEVARFFASLQSFDDYLASAKPMGCSPQQLFQAGIADALTHVGQLAMLRGLAGIPIRGENYFLADIVTGKVGADQSAPHFEF